MDAIGEATSIGEGLDFDFASRFCAQALAAAPTAAEQDS